MRSAPSASHSRRKIERPSSLSIQFLSPDVAVRSVLARPIPRSQENQLTYNWSCPKNTFVLCSLAQLQERMALWEPRLQ